MEFVKANGAEYACEAVVTGIDSISMLMKCQAAGIFPWGLGRAVKDHCVFSSG